MSGIRDLAALLPTGTSTHCLYSHGTHSHQQKATESDGSDDMQILPTIGFGFRDLLLEPGTGILELPFGLYFRSSTVGAHKRREHSEAFVF